MSDFRDEMHGREPIGDCAWCGEPVYDGEPDVKWNKYDQPMHGDCTRKEYEKLAGTKGD